MSDDHWYVLGPGKQPQGPFTSSDIARRFAAGELSAATRVNRAGTDDWVLLGTVAGPTAPAAPPPPKQGPIDTSLRANLRSLVGLVVLLVVVGAGYWAYTGIATEGKPFAGPSPISGTYCTDGSPGGWELDFVRAKATILLGKHRGGEFPLEVTTSGFVIKFTGHDIVVGIIDTDAIEIRAGTEGTPSQLRRSACK